jgi:regulator of protease activity HflC (stomatin/prohibitin superfamily)
MSTSADQAQTQIVQLWAGFALHMPRQHRVHAAQSTVVVLPQQIMHLDRKISVLSVVRAQTHEQLLQQAEGYKQQVIAKAEGEAKRFISVYDEYKNAKDVTKRRIYLETMEEILKGMDKIVLDSKGGVVPYLPLNELNSKR